MQTPAKVLLNIQANIVAFPANGPDVTVGVIAKFNREKLGGANVMTIVEHNCLLIEDYMKQAPSLTQDHRSAVSSAINNYRRAASFDMLARRWSEYVEIFSREADKVALTLIDFILSHFPNIKNRQINVDEAKELLDDLTLLIDDLAIPEFVKTSLRIDIERMRIVLGNYDRFGEGDFWEKHAKITGMLGSLYDVMNDVDKKKSHSILQRLIERTRSSMAISSDVITIGQAFIALLPKA